MIYNRRYLVDKGVKKKGFSFPPTLPLLKMSAPERNASQSPSRGLRQSFSEQISDIKTKLSRALSSERPNLNHDGSSQYSQLGESFFVVENDTSAPDRCGSRRVSVSQGPGCLGGKPIALSTIDGVRSAVGVRTWDDVLVYNPPVLTPGFLVQSPFAFSLLSL